MMGAAAGVIVLFIILSAVLTATHTAVFLASEDAKMIHGETIIVDAGWSVW